MVGDGTRQERSNRSRLEHVWSLGGVMAWLVVVGNNTQNNKRRTMITQKTNRNR